MSRLCSTESTMTAVDNAVMKAFEELSQEEPSTLTRLHKESLFLKNAVNLLIGESKSGKTFTTIKSLIDIGLKEHIIHLDFDRNADESLKKLGVQTYNIANPEALLHSLKQIKTDERKNALLDKILVIDSLQDLSFGQGIDSNDGAKATMERILVFQEMNCTIILIHHVTKSENTPFSAGYKIKGNSSTISSKCDCCIGLDKRGATRTLTVMFTRAEDKIESGTQMTYGNSDAPPK